MSLPRPEPGLVISYAYLWHSEHEAGHEEGRKDRPSVIVLSVERGGGAGALVTVLPITHSAPTASSWAVEVPSAVKRHLGLDHERSWVVVSEGNEFVWPGYDLRKVSGANKYDHGFLPPRYFRQIVEAFVECHRMGRSRNVARD